jgi:hypothetical protein
MFDSLSSTLTLLHRPASRPVYDHPQVIRRSPVWRFARPFSTRKHVPTDQGVDSRDRRS